MRVYECGEWKWSKEHLLPTKRNCWGVLEEETCIEANARNHDNSKRRFFTGGRKKFYSDEISYIVRTLQQFYEAQKPPITQEMLDEINVGFDSQNN